MNEETLVKAGLVRNEAKVYLALLMLGTASITEISRKSGVERTLVYGVIEKLMEKGLVSSVVKINKKYFEPADPEKILDLIKEKEKFIESALPELKGLFKSVEKKQEVHHYKGKEGAKTILETLLKEKDKEWLIFGTTGKTAEVLSYYLPQFHRKRVEAKINFKAIYSEDSLDRAKEIKKIKLTEVKILPKEYMTPTHISIVGDKVGIILWSEQPLGILIENKDIAESFRNYFRLLWNIAKKL
jgi:sugar-specific transcriptional regulator TrmB